MTDPADSSIPDPQKLKSRSPNYPSIPLREAIERAKLLYEVAKRHAVGRPVVVKAWGYSLKSSAGLQTIAALRAFGLLDVEGRGDNAQYKLTTEALYTIVEPENSDRRKKAVQDAALMPEAYRMLHDHYGSDLPADDAIRSWLVVDQSFTESAANQLISDYKDTIAFAQLDSGGTIPEQEQLPKVGDLVQWTSQGALQFEIPRQVLGISPDGGFAFVDGTNTGIPMSELTVEKANSSQAKPGTPPLNPFVIAGASGPGGSSKLKADDGVEENRWKLKSGTAIVYLPVEMTEQDFRVLRGQIDLLELSTLGEIKTGKSGSN